MNDKRFIWNVYVLQSINHTILMFLGEFSPSVFFKVAAYAIIPTLFIIYWISQELGHQPPFPQCWISDCAGHYPQFVFFRIATISGSVLVILGWLTNHFYLKSICKEAVFRIESYFPEIPLIMGMMGGMLLMGSTANLDTGKRHPKWHTFCASHFFIFTLLALVYNTIIYCLVRRKVKTVSLGNLYFKIALVVAMLIQLYISSAYGNGIFPDEVEQGLKSVHVIIEWTLTFTVAANFYSMALDVEGFKFVYEQSGAQKEIDEVD